MIAVMLALQVALTSVGVVDGDTLHDNVSNRDYRLHAVDTPETERAKCDAERALGEAAARRVGALLEAATQIAAIPAWNPRGRDRWPRDGFGRRIAIIELDGVSLGDTLLAEGLARPYSGSGPRPDWCS